MASTDVALYVPNDNGDALGSWWDDISSTVAKIGGVVQSGAAIAQGVATTVQQVRNQPGGVNWQTITPGVVAAVAQQVGDNIATAARGQSDANAARTAQDQAALLASQRVSVTTVLEWGALAFGSFLLIRALSGGKHR